MVGWLATDELRGEGRGMRDALTTRYSLLRAPRAPRPAPRAVSSFYSLRNATSGSTRVARTAGMRHAARALAPRTLATVTNTDKSLG